LWIENSIARCGNESVEAIFFIGFAAEYVPQVCSGHLDIDHRNNLQ
jgi:hypothetical protein